MKNFNESTKIIIIIIVVVVVIIVINATVWCTAVEKVTQIYVSTVDSGYAWRAVYGWE